MKQPLKTAPDFTLHDQKGIQHSLRDYRGHWVVLYFYPRDNSLGCTTEACNFRDEYRIIAQFGAAEVIGINKGSVKSHQQFARRHHLEFPILSDPGHKVTKAYGAWLRGFTTARLLDKPFGTRRNTYLIDPDGNIVKEYITVNPDAHAAEVITDLQAFQSSAAVEKSRGRKNINRKNTV
jgi:peroxiredoxin Q/BCP